MKRRTPATPSQGFKVWQLAVTIPAMGLMISVALGTLPEPDQSQSISTQSNYFPGKYRSREAIRYDAVDPAPPVEVLPFNLRGEVPGPLLASILQRYIPASTPTHADDLRDTLPPCDNPRMIVILPEAEDAVF